MSRFVRSILKPVENDCYIIYWLCEKHECIYHTKYTPGIIGVCYGVEYNSPCGNICREEESCSLVYIGTRRFSGEKQIVDKTLHFDFSLYFSTHTLESLYYSPLINEEGEIIEMGNSIK